jgi:hypothetical protein
VLGPVRCATLALLFLTAGFATMAGWAEPAGLFAGTALMALGQSLAFPALVTLAVGRAPAAERGAVIGTFSAFVDVAIVGGAAGLGVIVAASGYRAAFLGLRDRGRCGPAAPDATRTAAGGGSPRSGVVGLAEQPREAPVLEQASAGLA